MHPSTSSENELVVNQPQVQCEHRESPSSSRSPHAIADDVDAGIDPTSVEPRMLESNQDSISKSETRASTDSKASNEASTVQSCPCCGKEASLICSRCRVQRYCSRECQQVHWKDIHKEECKCLTGRTIVVDLKGQSNHEVWDNGCSTGASCQKTSESQTQSPKNQIEVQDSRTCIDQTSSSIAMKNFPLKVQVALNNPHAPMMCYNESRTLQSLIHYPNCKKARLLDKTIRDQGFAGGAKAYFNASVRSDGRLVIYLDQRLEILSW